ncbi:MAG: cytochrome c [Gammaproteobacteria bacterium]|nr:cytochrome c [Gammaproteobacteria bacterium]
MFRKLSVAYCFVALLILTSCSTVPTTGPSLGTPVSPSQVAGFDLIVGADGNELPSGSGTAAQGEAIYQARCQSCHGADGEGLSSATRLVGGSMQSEGRPIRTVGSYWPYATTVFDFIRRAMPADAPKSLTDEEVYQVTAYVLFMNNIIDREAILNRDSLSKIEMPNRHGFIDQSNIQ